MGLLVNGKWESTWYDTKKTKGQFKREASRFRNYITNDATGEHPAAKNRYHLYVSHACPWANRTLIFRKLKGLESIISVSVVDPFMGENGWAFSNAPNCIPDPIHNADYLHQVYTAANPTYTGRVTVPVLWDKQANTIVNNESSEIIRMLNSAFDQWADTSVDFYPADKREAIDEINAYVYDNVNNGVYRAGFATTQEAYETAVTSLFSALDTLEQRLGNQRYLVGDAITEADWRLFTTLVRFDPVYVGHFKCNIRRIFDYEHLWNYTRELYQVPGVAETIHFQHIKNHYYQSHTTINPTGVVPVGPEIDFNQPHTRG